MDLQQEKRARHSVRANTDAPIPQEAAAALRAALDADNARYGLKMRLLTDEPTAFRSFFAHYGKFKIV